MLQIPFSVYLMRNAFEGLTSWNEFLAALIMMNKETSLPVMVTGVRIGQQSSVDWGALQAGVIVSMIPCILIYILLQY
jgi:multiple sugar transport system permease protein